mmetsp:Transcript_1460/g.3766  ORF Transcript_1460/g.3766 Transcript_1460/m.3766 type:complete len:147 (-) Transcript_1460:5-445(-)|eukprot:CAMPEP_0197489720 /NCGR_PEP_ID=MMETSP1311-20131121/4440_1 /TAXON_ID=464262 /ORGANISM="Genus nov. species nov., Strain RCC856" /LENGTH=146 /DNA_ID=CAMNT_0043034085 /DNA_START=73 /DNA_END=513 /DNA_ORIENTATION=-
MAPLSFLPKEFGYAIGVVGLTVVVAQYGAGKVMGARKKYGIKYPTLYSTGKTKNDIAYNCAQRAHQNTLENLPAVNIMMLSSATVYPVTAAAFGAIWCVGRVLYIRGYTAESGPDGRRFGALISHMGDLPLLITTFMAAWAMVNQA